MFDLIVKNYKSKIISLTMLLKHYLIVHRLVIGRMEIESKISKFYDFFHKGDTEGGIRQYQILGNYFNAWRGG